jgi:alkaline phosphatase
MPGHRHLVPAALLALTLAGAAGARAGAAPAAAPADATAAPRNVVLMIPDGCGPAQVTLARRFSGRPLVLDSLLVGAVQTYSADSHVTDSAASATAYATGVKTRNRMLGVDPDERPLGTLIEAAAARGMATGLVTTSDLTDATPAAFAVHIAQRALQDSIAVELLERHVDVLMGGDRSRWFPETAGGRRHDGRDLLAEHRARGGTVATTPAELAAARHLPLLGLFGIGLDQLALEIDRDTLREPSLAQMTAKALELLGPAPRGFFVMIEGGHIDDTGHDDDPAANVREVLAYDRAVAQALAFARRDGHTLVVSVADHETGGLGLGRRVGRSSPYVVSPESLLTACASVWKMSGDITAGADPVAVAERGTGFATLDDDERAALRTAAAAPDSVRRFGLLRALSETESRRASVGWSTGGHTGVDVGLYAWGPGRERFVGLHENTEVSRLIAELLGLDLDAETARLRGAPAKPSRR